MLTLNDFYRAITTTICRSYNIPLDINIDWTLKKNLKDVRQTAVNPAFMMY